MSLTESQARFKQIRTTLGLGQVEFAAAAKIKQSQVSQIETGSRDLTESIIALLELHLKVNRDWLVNGEGEIFTGEVKVESSKERKPRTSWTNVNGSKNDKVMQGQRLRYFREQEGMSTEQLAKEFGIQSPALNKYENGKLTIPTGAIVYLHRKYRLNYEWFFDGEGYPKYKPGKKGSGAVTLDTLAAKVELLEKQIAG